MSARTDTAIGALRPRVQRPMPLAFVGSILRFSRRKPLGGIGLFIVVIFLVTAVFAPVLAPKSYDQQNLRERLASPSAGHLMGTDDRGRDMFSRIIYGARVSIFIGLGVMATALLIATTVGLVTGFYGGWLDTVVQRFVDMLLAIPFLILALTLVAVLPRTDRDRDIGPFTLGPAAQAGVYIVLALGITTAISSSRVIRGAALSIKGNQYIEAARSVGATDGRLLVRYLLPNIAPTLLVLATVQLGAAILAESALQFLGFGIPPPVPSWGGMLSGPARNYITQEPLLSVWPGLAIALTVFGFNMLGDALRDVLDPRLRGGR